MKAISVPIDKAGRIALPKWVREQAQVVPGDELRVSVEGQRIQLEPTKVGTGLVRKGKALVFRGSSGKQISSDMVESLRQERLDAVSDTNQTKRRWECLSTRMK